MNNHKNIVKHSYATYECSHKKRDGTREWPWRYEWRKVACCGYITRNLPYLVGTSETGSKRYEATAIDIRVLVHSDTTEYVLYSLTIPIKKCRAISINTAEYIPLWSVCVQPFPKLDSIVASVTQAWPSDKSYDKCTMCLSTIMLYTQKIRRALLSELFLENNEEPRALLQ